jgi:hypothetical protein
VSKIARVEAYIADIMKKDKMVNECVAFGPGSFTASRPVSSPENAYTCRNQEAPTCRNLPSAAVMKLPHVQTHLAAEY